MQVGLVGIGVMGSRMARCLIEAGYEITINDIRRDAAANLLEIGASWADNPSAVAEVSDVVITSLPGPPEVEKVVLGAETGILAGLQSGKANVDMTTNSPAGFRKVAEACRIRRVDVLDAPVSGGAHSV